jgi:hypothetical protein
MSPYFPKYRISYVVPSVLQMHSKILKKEIKWKYIYGKLYILKWLQQNLCPSFS